MDELSGTESLLKEDADYIAELRKNGTLFDGDPLGAPPRVEPYETIWASVILILIAIGLVVGSWGANQ